MPPSIQQSNAKHYKSETITEIKEFTGPHLLPAPPGWEEVADYALDWALEHAVQAEPRVTAVRLTHIGGPTVLIEVGGWRLLTDPTFDTPGRRYTFGWGAASRKLTGPAIPAEDLGADRRGAAQPRSPRRQPRRRRPGAAAVCRVVVTTGSGARRLGGTARGLRPWQTTGSSAAVGPAIEITATPCRHGPPPRRPIIGDVIGFALRWDGQADGALWISGDTVLYDGVREVAERFRSTRRCCTSGACGSPVTGPVRYTMTAREAVELLRPRAPARRRSRSTTRAGSHFKQGRAADRVRVRASAGRRPGGASAGCRSGRRSTCRGRAGG